MDACEKDLALASEYLEKKNASVDQLADLSVRILAYAEVLPPGPGYAAAFSRLKLQATQLRAQIRKMQSSLLDDIQRQTQLWNDRRIARALELQPSTLSRLRSGHLFFGATVIVRIHEVTDWPIRDIKSRLNLRCLDSMVTR